MLFHIAEIRRRVGEQRTLHASAVVDDASSGTVLVDPEVEVVADLLVEAVAGGFAVTGVLRGRWSGECRRCLDPTAGSLEVSVAEVFEDSPTDGETYPIDGDVIDLAPMIRESLILGLPLSPLCRDECPGPVPDAFPVVVADDEAGAPRDPRWAALDALRDPD